jgi:hypothetical protein
MAVFRSEAKLTNPAFWTFTILIILVLATGCTVSHVPKPDTIETGAIPNIRGTSTVLLINGQSDQTVRELGRAGFGTMTGDLRAWTDAAIAQIKTELEKAGLKAQPDGKKSLKVTVVEAELGVSGIDFVAAVAKCRVRLKVEAGDGSVKDGNIESNALAPLSACDKAMSRAVVSLLNDASIVGYLNQ